MKSLSKYLYIPALLISLLTGCTKHFDETNTDTNSVTSDNYIPVYNLTKAQLEFSGNIDFSYDTWRVNIIYCGMMMQQLANTTWYSGDKYLQKDAYSSAYFDVAYRDQIKYIADLLEITRGKTGFANLYQVARINKVLIMHRLTDLYGDVPYSEAGLGFHNRVFTPKYDSQQFIYADMLKELEEAASALDPGADLPGPGDLIYKGAGNSIALYKKLAYSLMLRLGMRLSKVDAVAAKSWVEKAAAGGVFTSNADNAFILHDNTGGRATVNRISNILGGEWNATDYGVTDQSKWKNEVFLSKTFIDFLKNSNDPRLPFTSRVKSTGNSNASSQIGLPNGYDQIGGNTDISRAPGYPGSITGYSTIRGDVYLSLTGPTYLLTYAQTSFLLAEAAQRGWNVGGTVAMHYGNGIRAAMKQLKDYNSLADIPDAAIDDFLALNPYNAERGMEQINAQYWAASFLDWYETWANWRRCGYPLLQPVNYPGNATGGQIPRRMLYPAAEASANGKNLQEAISRQGANDFMTRVWWDQK
jgi:hypothetical protein